MTARTPPEKGNAFIVILVAIVLLAALTAFLMRSSSRSLDQMAPENARLVASKLLNQSQSYETAIRKLTAVNGCSENQLNFDNTQTSRSYTNASAPSNKNCDLFSYEGAGLAYSAPDSAVLDPLKSAESDFGDWVFMGVHCILEVGGGDTTGACTEPDLELLAIVPHVNHEVCLQINNLSGITNTASEPPEEDFDETGSEFVGDFTLATDPEIGEGATGTNLIRHTAGCFEDTSGTWSGNYIFYKVLLAR